MLAEKMIIMQETDIVMYDFTGINIHPTRIPVIENFSWIKYETKTKSVLKKKKEQCNCKQEKNKHIPIKRINKNYKPSSIQNSTWGEIIVSCSYNSENVQQI